ncbi:glycosyltransferase [Escherichia coli]|uniref:glycosyltransferase n=1 Tax=Escherichia coli TaxID=562 RepID=UPI001F178090|nr:glycosyltransferase [Escherichia coli]MCF3272987.1 glycosyltransferase [Escherichia coli]
MKRPYFSFLLCVNKDEGFLNDALESIINQDYSYEYEIIVIANNCDDNLWAYLNSVESDKLKIHRTNIGQLAFNLNYGANIARGEYIVRMDADDVSTPNRLKILEAAIQENNYPDVIGTSVYFISETGRIIKKYVPPLGEVKSALIKNPFVHPTVAIKKVSLFKIGGYLGGFQSEDNDLWIRMLRAHGFKLVNIDSVTLFYRINDHQTRGRVLPYAEVASYALREFLLKKRIKYFAALLINIGKALILPKR